MKSTAAALLIAISCCAAGTMSIYSRGLTSAGMDAYQISFLRMGLSALIIGAVMFFFKRECFRIDRRDIRFFLLFGLAKFVSDLLVIVAYDYVKASLTAALQLTQIYFVIAMAIVLFHEKITRTVLVSTIISTFALILMSGIIDSPNDISFIGIAAGLGSGFCFAVYMLSSKVLNDRHYDPMTGTFYVFLFGAAFALPLSLVSGGSMVNALSDPYNILLVVCICLVSTLIPYFIEMLCIRWVPIIYISLLDMTVLIGACLTGLVAFGESVTICDIFGMALMFGAVALMAFDKNKIKSTEM